MTNPIGSQFEQHVYLCKPQYKSTVWKRGGFEKVAGKGRVDELWVSRIINRIHIYKDLLTNSPN